MSKGILGAGVLGVNISRKTEMFSANDKYSEIASILFFNPTSEDITVYIYILDQWGQELQCGEVILSPKDSNEWSSVFRLGGNSKLRAYSDIAGINYHVFGTTE